ncbi:MAG: tetratricopeptide repeat protein [Bacteroidota bacterium]
MKKLLLLGAFVISLTTQAQKKEWTSAYNANRDGDFVSALKYMGEAAGYPEALTKEKHFRYYGEIYMNIALDSTYMAQYPNAYFEALANYTKALELSKDYEREIKTSVERSRSIMEAKAIAAYNAKNTCLAGDYYKKLQSSGAMFGVNDTLWYYYGGMCQQACGNFDDAIASYEKAGSLNFEIGYCYSQITTMLLSQSKKDEAIAKLQAARLKYPKNVDILRSEVNIYIDAKDYQKALNLLEELSKADPSNESIWFVLGVTYEKNEKWVEAENAYSKALDVKSDYFDALYNLGVIWYNKGVSKSKECDGIRGDAYQPCLVEKRAIFSKAAEYFERTRAIDATDDNLKKVLIECYRKSNQADKAEGVK